MVLLRNSLRALVGGIGLGVGLPAGYQAWRRAEDLQGFFTSIGDLLPALLQKIGAALSAATVAAPKPTQSVEMSALLLSQQSLSNAMQNFLRSHNRVSSSSILGVVLPLGLVGALAAAWWRWGWEGFGWASVEQLKANLEIVRKFVADKIEDLKEEMLNRFSSIAETLTQCTQRVEQV